MNFRSRIIGAGSAFPEKIMTNQDFEAFLDTNDEWIRTRTGITTRRIANAEKGETTLSLSLQAAENALKQAGLKGSDLDAIIVGSVTPESLMPTTANSLQAKLGAVKAFSFDLQAACSGFIYAFSTADNFIRSGMVKNALVIGAETLSTVTNWQDRGTCILFGDAAGAMVLTRSSDNAHAILSTRLYSDGTKGEILKMDPLTDKIKMQGSELFKLAVRAMVDASQQVLKDNEMKITDVDYFIFHQANIRIIDMCLKTLNIDRSQTWINLDKYGNTSAATLPVCLDEAWKAGKVKEGDVILMSTFGGGLTWGSSLVRL